ncbi:hypothetical protein TWF506_009326 [Arthrobotrys conoides]|uniref:CHAT domain-containing protein n=1 Tax=Arthrobotrys conoides TaxID=74498 RepID=A0AAN8RTH7_9PEZI
MANLVVLYNLRKRKDFIISRSGSDQSFPKHQPQGKATVERYARYQETCPAKHASACPFDNGEPDELPFADIYVDTDIPRLSKRVNDIGSLSIHSIGSPEPILFKHRETIQDAGKHFDVTTQCENSRMHAPESFQSLPMEGPGEHSPDEPAIPAASVHMDVEKIDHDISQAQLDLLFYNGPNIDRAEKLNDIGELFLTRWRLGIDTNDIELAIGMKNLAQELVGHSCSGKGKYLLKVQAMLMEKFQATNQTIDIDRAIQVGEELVQFSTTSGNENTRPVALHNLATCLEMRYTKDRDMQDMNKAIGALEEALVAEEWSPTGHERHMQEDLEDLGRLWLLKYDRTQSVDDLDRAIEQFRLSMTRGVTTGNLQSGYHFLGVCYQARYRLTGFSGDIQQATDMAKAAVGFSLSSPHRELLNLSAYWFNLGSYTYQNFIHTTDWKDLETAIDSFEEALIIPDLSPDQKCMALCQLGDSLVMRYGVNQAAKLEDLSKAESVLKEAFETRGASSINRASAARSLAYKLAYREKWEEALIFIQKGVSLLPTFDLDVKEESRQSNIEAFSGLSRDGAAVALNASGTPLEALSLLEQGRGLLYNSIQITKAMLPIEVGKVSGSIFSYSSDEILSAVGKDRIAVINVSKFRCDAILVGRGRIEVVPLTELDPEVIDGKTRLLQNGGDSAWGVLEWLWEAVALPILQRFEIYQRSTKGQEGSWSGLRDKGESQKRMEEETPITDECLPHIWWIATGQLTQLPIHAAGKHFKHSGETVLDRVISSYAVSVKSFIENRQGAAERSYNTSGKALIVSMPKTPGHSPLHFAGREAGDVSSTCQSLNLSIVKPDLPYGKEEILKQLQDCQIFHFAGHGLSDPTNPSQSHLLLDDWRKSPLAVQDLQSLNLHDNPPFLAYLSACSTGSNKVMTLCDESINLIGASQSAGFRHVIGSLWEVNDLQCASVAKTVYETIAKKGLTNFAVALGLHRASVRLRNGVVSKKFCREARNPSSRDTNFSSKLNSITLAWPEDPEPYEVTEFPNWLNAELKSYRSTPLRQVKDQNSTKTTDTMLSLPVEVVMFRQVPLQPEVERLSSYTNRSRDGLVGRAPNVESEPKLHSPRENAPDTVLRNPVKTKSRKPHLHWAPYVHFGI